MIELLILLI